MTCFVLLFIGCLFFVILIFLGAIIIQNSTILLPARGAYGGENKIEYFFPFDPYLMKNSFQHFTSMLTLSFLSPFFLTSLLTFRFISILGEFKFRNRSV